MKTKYQRLPGLDAMSNGNWLRSFLDDLAATFFRITLEVYFVSRKEKKKNGLVDRLNFKKSRNFKIY